MPVIHTKTNMVQALEPAEDDPFCQLIWLAPGEPHAQAHTKQFHGPVMPIEDYQRCADDAIELADQMVLPVIVLPLSTHEGFVEAMEQPDWHGPALRQRVAERWIKLMLDSDGRTRRQVAHDMLINLGVVNP